MKVTLFCTWRKTHAPVAVYVYDGQIPVPDSWRWSAPSTVSELVCWRSHPGGCGYSPRPSDAAMRALINAAAINPILGDVSYSGL